MSFFYIFLLLAIGAVGGYMIGHDTGKEEGYIDGRVEMYDEVVSAYETKSAIYKEKR